MDKNKIFVLLPTYNERENVEKIISKIFEYQPEIKILVIDDNSPDGTKDIVRNLKNKYKNLDLLVREKKEGLGRAYLDTISLLMKKGVAEAFVTIDADLSHDPKYLSKMLELSKNYDLVVGSRYMSGGGTVGWELWRRILSRWGNIYSKIITGAPINDLTGGFNFIKTSALKAININDIDSSGYAFEIELKYRIWKSGAKVVEFPIIFLNRIGGESKISNHIISEGIMAPWKIRFRK
jgi:dolichol-phosphate mannosyltransferase